MKAAPAICLPCPDWADRIQAGGLPFNIDPLRPFLNLKRIAAAKGLFGELILPDTPERITLAEAVGDWFTPILEAVAGSLQTDATGERITGSLINTLFLCVAKKNAKTTACAALALVLLMLNRRPRASFIMLAPTLKITEIGFAQLTGMIYQHPGLCDLLDVAEHKRTVTHRRTGATLTCISFDAKVATGSKASGIVVDEVHLLTSPQAMSVIRQLRGARAAIPECLTIFCTTHADRPPAGAMKAMLDLARDVRDGREHVPGFLPAIFEPPPHLAANLESMANLSHWRFGNPNLGRSVSLEFLRETFHEAQGMGPAEVLKCLSQHANVEVSTFGAAMDAWSGAQIWPDCGGPRADFDALLAQSTEVAFGLDCGGADDLAALAAAFRMADGTIRLWGHVWIWPIALERRKSIATTLQEFAAQGDLSIVPAGQDLLAAAAYIIAADKQGKLTGCGMDPKGQVDLFTDAIEAGDVDPKQLTLAPQGYALKSGFDTLERWLHEGVLTHCGQSVFDWCVANCRYTPNHIIGKNASGVGKIDLAVAGAMAVQVLAASDGPFDPDAWVGTAVIPDLYSGGYGGGWAPLV